MFKKGQFTQKQGRKIFEKEEESKKDPIICFECKKSGHIKVDYPKLRKDKRSSKENLKNSKGHLWLGKKVILTHPMMNKVIKKWQTCVLLPKKIYKCGTSRIKLFQ